MSTNQTIVAPVDNTDDTDQTVVKRIDWNKPDFSVVADEIRKADENDEAIQKVLKRARAIKPGTPDVKDKLAEVTREFANLTINASGLGAAAAAMSDLSAEARKRSNAHTRYRTEILGAWLNVYPDGYHGLRSDVARALFGRENPSKGNLMTVGRDLNALMLTRAAAAVHKVDPTKPALSVEAARTLVTNASPEERERMLANVKAGKPAVQPKDESKPVPVKAADAIKRLETAVDYAKRVEHVTDEQRKRMLVILSDLDKVVRGYATTPEPKGEAQEK
jgi:hypothetical protein